VTLWRCVSLIDGLSGEVLAYDYNDEPTEDPDFPQHRDEVGQWLPAAEMTALLARVEAARAFVEATVRSMGRGDLVMTKEAWTAFDTLRAALSTVALGAILYGAPAPVVRSSLDGFDVPGVATGLSASEAAEAVASLPLRGRVSASLALAGASLRRLLKWRTSAPAASAGCAFSTVSTTKTATRGSLRDAASARWRRMRRGKRRAIGAPRNAPFELDTAEV
jgi:hypothetical protein